MQSDKSKKISLGFKCVYYGKPKTTSGDVIIVSVCFHNSVTEVHRYSDRLMKIPVAYDNRKIHIFSEYAPQAGTDKIVKERFWTQIDELTTRVPKDDMVIIAADLNGHVGVAQNGHKYHGVKEFGRRGVDAEHIDKRSDALGEEDRYKTFPNVNLVTSEQLPGLLDNIYNAAYGQDKTGLDRHVNSPAGSNVPFFTTYIQAGEAIPQQHITADLSQAFNPFGGSQMQQLTQSNILGGMSGQTESNYNPFIETIINPFQQPESNPFGKMFHDQAQQAPNGNLFMDPLSGQMFSMGERHQKKDDIFFNPFDGGLYKTSSPEPMDFSKSFSGAEPQGEAPKIMLNHLTGRFFESPKRQPEQFLIDPMSGTLFKFQENQENQLPKGEDLFTDGKYKSAFFSDVFTDGSDNSFNFDVKSGDLNLAEADKYTSSSFEESPIDLVGKPQPSRAIMMIGRHPKLLIVRKSVLPMKRRLSMQPMFGRISSLVPRIQMGGALPVPLMKHSPGISF